MLTWELLGALLGAGFASGREIAAFFARYGKWGYAGAALAAVVLVWLAGTEIPTQWKGRWQARIWQMLLTALLIATGGAMLAGAGEVASLVLPWRGAYWVGMLITMLGASWLAHGTSVGLVFVSRSMVMVFVCVMIIGLISPGAKDYTIQVIDPMEAIARGLCYGGFNAALLIPVIRHSNASEHVKRRALCCTGAVTLLLIWVGCMALGSQPGLIYEAMPFVKLLNNTGKWGYFLSAACMYLAILSTLTACMRGLGRNPLCTCGIVLVSLLGFSRVVEEAYAVLGGACMAFLIMAKFMNCSRKAFISRADML